MQAVCWVSQDGAGVAGSGLSQVTSSVSLAQWGVDEVVEVQQQQQAIQ